MEGPAILEQLAAQDAGKAEDARTEQHEAAGLRSIALVAGAGAGASAAPQRERLRGNRSNGVFLGSTNLSSYPSKPDRRSVR